MSESSVESYKTKIKALLAKAESSEFSGERELYIEKAMELMVKYEIDEATLRGEDALHIAQIKEIDKVLHVPVIYAMDFVHFTGLIAQAMDMQCAVHKTFSYVTNKLSYNARVVCFAPDFPAFDMLVDSLIIQCLTSMPKYNKTIPTHFTPSQKYKARRGFILGFATAVANRIEMTRNRVSTSSKGELILASKKSHIDDYVSQLGWKLSASRKIGAHGISHGEDAGNRADIGTDRFGKNGTNHAAIE